jgi:hypothetical protein
MTTVVGPVNVAAGLPGGVSAVINITVAQVVKALPGICATLVCIAPGSAGSLVLNDCATTGAAAATNEFFSKLFSALSAGQVIPLKWPCGAGIVVSSVPTAGVFSIAFS